MTVHVLTVSNIYDNETETFKGTSYEDAYYNATDYIHETLERIKKENADNEDFDPSLVDEENDITIQENAFDAAWYYFAD